MMPHTVKTLHNKYEYYQKLHLKYETVMNYFLLYAVVEATSSVTPIMQISNINTRRKPNQLY